jgi:hypothetical protein
MSRVSKTILHLFPGLKLANNILEKICSLTDDQLNKIESIDPFYAVHKNIKDLILFCRYEPELGKKYIYACINNDYAKTFNIRKRLPRKQPFLKHSTATTIAEAHRYELPVLHLKTIDYYFKDILDMADVEERLLYRYAS